jgi:hypothetical protein
MIHHVGQPGSRGQKSYGCDRLLMRSITQEMAGHWQKYYPSLKKPDAPKSKRRVFAVRDPWPWDGNLEHFDCEEPCKCGAESSAESVLRSRGTLEMECASR